MQAPGPEMTDEEFLLLNEVITAQLGISFPDHKRDILASRLRPRLRELHLPRYLDYYLLLQSTLGAERARLTQLVTNNETYFFRETRQMDALFGPAAAELRSNAARPGTLSLLCAGCSTGEEAHARPASARSSSTSLEPRSRSTPSTSTPPASPARSALYGRNSFRATSAEQRERYFSSRGSERWEVKSAYRGSLRFAPCNIIDLPSFARALPYDVLFCRNVLIYFSEPALHRAIENFAQVLRPGGLLFLGAAESIIGLSSRFEVIRLGSVIAYRKA